MGGGRQRRGAEREGDRMGREREREVWGRYRQAERARSSFAKQQVGGVGGGVGYILQPSAHMMFLIGIYSVHVSKATVFSLPA